MKRRFPSLISLLLALLGASGLLLPAVGEIFITEMMVHPAHEGTVEPTRLEFIEIFNAGSRGQPLEDWAFDRGIRFRFPAVTIAPESRMIVAADQEAFAERYPAVAVPVLGNWEGRLSNSGEMVRLVNGSDDVVDEVRYADEGDWARRRRDAEGGWIWRAPFDGEGSSLELIDPRAPNRFGQNWASSIIDGGTPGEVNSVHRHASPPLLTDVAHDPPVPRPTDFVRVHARPLSVHGTPHLDLFYRRSTQEPGSFIQVGMRDDGSFGDARAGDGVYSAEIPPHADGEVVEFFVRATNAAGARTWPAPSDDAGSQETNALYQVDASEEIGTQAHYRTILSIPEFQRFRSQNFSNASNARMHATFIASRDGKTTLRYQASIRRRGNGSRHREPRSYRISLPQDQPWDGMTELNLVSQYSYLQTLGMHLFLAAGLPAPQSRLVQLRLNGINDAHRENRFAVHYGSYAHIEPLGSEFIDRAFPNDASGNLYKKASAGSNRDHKRWGVHFEETRVYKEVPEWYKIDRWTKETNSADDDWSDLQDFIVTMNEADGPAYYSEVTKRIDLDQWLRWFALMVLLNNRETGLSNGIDDDYSLYRGVEDPRFLLLPHDLDTILGQGDTPTSPTATIFQMIDSSFGNGAAVMPQLRPFMDHPTIRLGYFRQLADLLDTALAPASFEPLVDQLLPHVPDDRREQLKAFMRARRTHVLGIIDAPNEVDLSLDQRNGLWITDQDRIDLSGRVSSLDTATVLVQGIPASYDRGSGRWTLQDLSPRPGVNEWVIQTFDHAGTLLDTRTALIWRRTDVPSSLAPLIVEDLTLTAARSPYLVEAITRVVPGATLTIEPGVTLYFKTNAKLIVEGALRSRGEPQQRVLLTIDPREEAGSTWNGMVLTSSASAECFWTTWHRATSASGSLRLEGSHATLEGVHFGDSDEIAIVGQAASLTLKHGRFTSRRAGYVRMEDGLSPTGSFLVEACHFEIIASDAPAIAVKGRRSSDSIVAELRANTFDGSAGTLVHLEGAALVDGNRFAQAPTGVNLADGRDDQRVALSRNRFHGVGTAVVGASAPSIRFENNLVSQSATGLGLHEGATGPVYASRNLFFAVTDPILNLAGTSGRLDERHNLEVFHASAAPPGEDPATWFSDQHLGPGISPAPFWTRTPPLSSPSESATFSVAGPGIVAYRHRLDGGPWSPFHAAAAGQDSNKASELRFDNLAAGRHRLEIEGRDLSGKVPHKTPLAYEWEVDRDAEPVVLNRLLALNRSVMVEDRHPDLVELHNRSDREVVLAGYRLSDDPDRPDRYLFPVDARIAAGGYLTLIADEAPSSQASGFWLGFSLDGDGESLTLYREANRVADRVVFGSQAPDIFLGRRSEAPDRWGPVRAGLGEANETLPYASAPLARINEAYAAAGQRFGADFLELYNGTSRPLLLEGAFVTDDWRNDPRRHPFAPLTMLPPNGYLVLASGDRDGSGLEDASPLAFGLDDRHEVITLHDGSRLIDRVLLPGSGTESSIGRLPDGGSTTTTFAVPSPGMPNRDVAPPPDTMEVLVDWNAIWAFDESGSAPPSDWREQSFSDEAWPRGNGPLGFENDPLPIELATNLPLNPPVTHYFRHLFTVEDLDAISGLSLSVLVDDGVILYLNGEEIHRARMGTDGHNARATSGVGNATIEGPFEMDPSLLREGLNLLAASLHQDDDSSSDAVFAAHLALAREAPDDPATVNRRRLSDSLRITEVMYHPRDSEGSEWIELRNIGPRPLDVEGVRLVDGVAFTFPPLVLAPGDYVLVVENLTAFERRYGPGLPVAGAFTGKLDNAGEQIALAFPLPDTARIQTFTYNKGWHPATDGGGRSLVIRDERRPVATWQESGAWSAGSSTGGTPGRPEIPVIYAPLQDHTILGDAYATSIRATHEPFRYGAEGLPAGLFVDEVTGAITGTPESYGSFEITFSATNASGTQVSPFRLEVAASGPLAAYRWDPLGPNVPVDTPVGVGLAAVDSEGRIVRDHEAAVDLMSAAFEAGSPVLITEIFDAGPDGLEIQNLADAPVTTAGWRLLLNIGANADPAEVHGLHGSAGRIWHFPRELAPGAILLVTDDAGDGGSYIGFNVLWDHLPPGQVSVGGQHGWAVILDHENRPVDGVVWGYAREALAFAFVEDAGWSFWLEETWSGDGVSHRGETGLSLTRVSPIDTDNALGWAWVDETPGQLNSGLAAPVYQPSRIAMTPETTGNFIDGVWKGSVTFLEIAESARLRAYDPVSGLVNWSAPFAIDPLRAPTLPQPLDVTAVQGLPFDYLLPFGNHAVAHTATGLPPGLRLAGGGVLEGRPEEAGSFTLEVGGSNALGTAEGIIDLEVLADSDGDGMADVWEAANGFDENTPADGRLDADGDGARNRDEFLAGTDPRDSRSRFRLSVFPSRENPGWLELQWPSVPGRRYQLWEGRMVGERLFWMPLMDQPWRAAESESSLLLDPDRRSPSSAKLLRLETFWASP